MRNLVVAQVFVAVLFMLSSTEAVAQRKAFIVGISDYENLSDLESPQFDANEFRTILEAYGFNVTFLEGSNTDRLNFNNQWGEFVESLGDTDEVVIYYSGHGVEMKGKSYLIPVDAPSPQAAKNEQGLAGELISLSEMMDALGMRNVPTVIWILDACRNNPYAQKATGTKALGSDTGGVLQTQGPVGTFFFYAANFSQRAVDRLANDPPEVKMSLYTRVLVEQIKNNPDEPVTFVAPKVQKKVFELAKKGGVDQLPAYYAGLSTDWCFRSCSPEVASASVETLSTTIRTKDIISTVSRGDVRKGIESFSTLADNSDGNAIYLGSAEDATKCSEFEVSDRFPLGCNVLRAAKNAESGVLGKPLTVRTAVNMRYRAPTYATGQAAKPECAVGVVPAQSSVVLTAVVSTGAQGEYYWGVIGSSHKECSDKIRFSNPLRDTGADYDPVVAEYVDQLNSSDTKTRREAREKLGEHISDAKLVDALVKNIATSSYRYQIGVAVAISKAENGIDKILSDDARIELNKAAKATKDPTLKAIYHAVTQ